MIVCAIPLCAPYGNIGPPRGVYIGSRRGEHHDFISMPRPSQRRTSGWSAVETQCRHLRCSRCLRYRRRLERRLRRVEPGRQSEHACEFFPASRKSSSSVAGTCSSGRNGTARDGFWRRAGSKSAGRDAARHAGGAFRIQRQRVAKRSGRCRPELDASARRQCSLVGAARALCRDRNRVVDASRAPGRDDLVGFNALVPLDKIRSSPIFVF
jgi:hypothetical protein